MPTASAPLSSRLSRWMAILWVAVLWVPAAQMMFHPFPEQATLAENRTKVPPPLVGGGRFGIRREFPGEFERYFGDNFGFRDSLIRSHASFLYSVLRTSPTENVVLGKEGWLYYNRPDDGANITDYCGLAAIGEQDLALIERNLTTLASHLRERGILFALVVGPSKHTIYPEHLPDAIRPLAGETRLDQLARMLAGHPEIVFVDPRRALTAGKSRSQLYFKKDSHWNGAGAFLAYRELMTSLEHAGAAVTPPAEREYRAERVPPGLRDLSGMLGVRNPEMEADLSLERIPAPRYTMQRVPRRPGENPIFMKVRCETDDPGRPRLLMLRDSFTENLKSLLCPDFSRSIFFWRYSVDVAVIEAENPSILVLEFAERYLDQLKKGGLLRHPAPAAPVGGAPGG